jgi:hypothetical protein
VLLPFRQAAPVPRQTADNANQSTDERQKKPNQHKGQVAPTAASEQLAEKAIREKGADEKLASPNTQQPIKITELPPVSVTRDWMDKASWTFGGILVVEGIVGVCAACRTLRAIERQARIMRQQTTHKNSVIQATIAAQSAKASTDALIASERAWIDGVLVSSEILGARRYSLKIRNLGKTPAQIRSYRVSAGPLMKGTAFSPERLSDQETRNLHIFIGSGKTKTLETMINMGDLFPASDTEGTLCVLIKYADVVTGTPENRSEHETSFVYIFNLVTQSTDRLSIYNKYS